MLAFLGSRFMFIRENVNAVSPGSNTDASFSGMFYLILTMKKGLAHNFVNKYNKFYKDNSGKLVENYENKVQLISRALLK